jgi:peroxiredoxin
MAPQIAQVFAEEQQGWRDHGAPEDAVRAGDLLADFTLPDATGTPVSLSGLLGDGGWCPYCNIALRTYQAELLPQLDAFGARLVAISPQSPDQSLSTAEKAGLSFTVLSDARARIARRLGIAFQPAEHVLATQRDLGLDLTQVNAEGSPDLPMPTVLIVDQDRTVRFADTHADYTTRTEVTDILAALRQSESTTR